MLKVFQNRNDLPSQRLQAFLQLEMNPEITMQIRSSMLFNTAIYLVLVQFYFPRTPVASAFTRIDWAAGCSLLKFCIVVVTNLY